MINYKKHLTTVVIIIMTTVSIAGAIELTGWVSAEGRFFFNDPLYEGQTNHNGSVASEVDIYHAFDNGVTFDFVPFVRLDSSDSERSHFVIREFNLFFPAEEYLEFRLGYSRVFWGATEFVHLVDIINQTDFVENIDGEDKIGQQMAQLNLYTDYGALEFYALPTFTPRTFPGVKGRLRPPVEIAPANIYESALGAQHIDFAARYSHTIGNCDFGIHYFTGTNRDPIFVPYTDPGGKDWLVAYYEQINQIGLDVQLVTGEWLWKFEGIYRQSNRENFYAVTGGFEYTFYQLADTNKDLGVIAEYVYDGRDYAYITPLNNDIMLGARLNLNDTGSTQILAAFVQDLQKSENAISIEASRRIKNDWKLSLEAWLFLSAPEDSLYNIIRNDDFLRLELTYYFK